MATKSFLSSLSLCLVTDYSKLLGQKALIHWLVHKLPNASEPSIMKHMLLTGLKSCTEKISSQSQEHLIITSEN